MGTLHLRILLNRRFAQNSKEFLQKISSEAFAKIFRLQSIYLVFLIQKFPFYYYFILALYMDGSVRFTNVGILEFARPKFSEYFLLESDDEEENNKNFSSSNNVTPSRSSYYSSSSGSSGCTPVSITNELTNVDEDEDTLRVFPDV